MATLADSFLQDLEDLDEKPAQLDSPIIDKCVFQPDNEYTDIPDAVSIYIRSLEEGVTEPIVSDLGIQPEFCRLMGRVNQLRDVDVDQCLPDEDEYDLIDQCNRHVVKLDTEILNIHKFLRDLYSKKFPELESIVYSPLDYINIVRRIQNEMDLTKVDLSDLLHNTVIMAVTVAASMTTGTQLPPSELGNLLKASDEALHLAECRKYILLYLESRMQFLAPNLTAILGSSLGARLLSHAGGLQNLARMPAQNIMLIGHSKKSSLGMSSASAGVPMGIISMSELVQGVPNQSRNRALKYVCGKTSLAARIDSFRQSRNGEFGTSLREGIINALIKHQQPPPAPIKKSLPIPDEKKRSQRGGKRHRRMKEKYGLSDFRKLANRTKFGPEAEEEIGLKIGKGLGMLGKGATSGKIRLQAKNQKVQLPVKRAKQMAQTSGAIGGTASSLAFTF